VVNDPNGRGRNEALPIVEEYFQRKTLADLGFTSDANSIAAWKVDCFHAIAARIEEIRARERNKNRGK
jgi:hypothetical protein